MACAGLKGAMAERRKTVSFTMYPGTLHARKYVLLSRLANLRPQQEVSVSRITCIGTQWGVICPIEFPDNKDIGLTKHFAVLARD
jgi:hypothetical protein